MKSFQLEKGGTGKNQAIQSGGLFLIFGIIFYFLVSPMIGIILGALGLVLLLGGLFATESN